MVEYYVSPNINEPMDIHVCEYGVKTESVGMRSSPHDYYMVFYMVRGYGNFVIGSNAFLLTEGSVLILFPKEECELEVQSGNTCDYYWLGINGFKAKAYLKIAGISSQMRCLDFADADLLLKSFSQLVDGGIWGNGRNIWLSSIAHMILAIFAEAKGINREKQNENSKELYVREAVRFIEEHYWESVSIAALAEKIKVHRRHLWLVFKDVTGMSPQEYLIQFRMGRACELMRDSSLPLKAIANMTGYPNDKLFHRTFKHVKGLTPGEFRTSYIAPSANMLLQEWRNAGIGNLRVKGASNFKNGVFSIYSSGWDIWHDNDEFQFAYQKVQGDCTIVARVVSIRKTDRWAKAGIMMRNNLNTCDPCVCILATSGMGMNHQWRSAEGGFHESQNIAEIETPVFLKLIKSGQRCEAFYSQQGIAWIPLGESVLGEMSDVCFVGLAATSHDTRSLTCAVFDKVHVSSEYLHIT